MLILLRHGQTAVNAGGRLQGRIDAPLTEVGQAQARAAAAALGVPARVVASPLLRARETAAAFTSVASEVDDRWIELDYGELDGQLLRDVPAAFWTGWRSDPSFAPPGGESLLAVGQRVRAACEELRTAAAEGDDRDIVVVSHVSPIKAAVAWALGVGDEVTWRMHLDVAAVTRIGLRATGPVLVAFNERSHLEA